MPITGIRLGSTKLHLDAHTMNSVVESVLRAKAQSITQSPDLRKDIGEVYIDKVTPYVPKKSGKLRKSAMATNDGRVIWSAKGEVAGPDGKGGTTKDYAVTQYNIEHSHYTTPNTGSHWTDNVQPGTSDWDEFIEEITPMIIRRLQDE